MERTSSLPVKQNGDQTAVSNHHSLLEDAHLRFDFLGAAALEGWSSPEGSFRWMIDGASSLGCGPLSCDGDLDLIMHLTPFGDAQSLTIRVNATEIDRFTLRHAGWYACPLPRGSLSAAGRNRITFDHPDAKRPVDVSDSLDTRRLAVAVRGAALVPRLPDLTMASPCEPAAQGDAAFRRALAMRFESLGQNCEFGLFQRRCGAEPLGLLRFSSIRLQALIAGLEIGFADIADEDMLSFYFAEDNECQGRHTKYGLDYHTFRYRQDIALEDFARAERARLRFLTDRLMEQISQAEKIFVIQRPGLTLREVRPVLKLLRLYHPGNRVLWVSEAESLDKIGTIDLIGGACAHGHIDKLAPAENAPDLSFDVWIKICTTAAEVFREAPRSS